MYKVHILRICILYVGKIAHLTDLHFICGWICSVSLSKIWQFHFTVAIFIVELKGSGAELLQNSFVYNPDTVSLSVSERRNTLWNTTEHCKIDRLVNQYDEATGTMLRVLLHTVGSSKICRKAHIDISNKAQINMYATGLHEVGSSAVEHYSMLEILDLFTLLCAAFNQPQYRIDK